MVALLKSVVSTRHIPVSDANLDVQLDMAYITKRLIVSAGPTSQFPKTLYRNNVKELRKYLEYHHGDNWAIWEFRAEGCGYDDSELCGRVTHFPFKDHNPPPFNMIPVIVNSIHAYLSEDEKNVAVLHCKAGKGRSGSMACAYLIGKLGFSTTEAMDLFTEKRMRRGLGFGKGISIYSQIRYLEYYADWIAVTKEISPWLPINKKYGFYENIPAAIDFIKIRHTTRNLEVGVVEYIKDGLEFEEIYTFCLDDIDSYQKHNLTLIPKNGPVLIKSDTCFTFLQRAPGSRDLTVGGAYFWMNIFFETFLKNKKEWTFNEKNGSFSINWREMDGFKGTHQKGLTLFDSVEVHWHLVH